MATPSGFGVEGALSTTAGIAPESKIWQQYGRKEAHQEPAQRRLLERRGEEDVITNDVKLSQEE